MSNVLRVEAQGKIKVSIVSPTGVPGTALASAIVDRSTGAIGATAQDFESNYKKRSLLGTPEAEPAWTDQDNVQYLIMQPEEIVGGVMYCFNQPSEVNVSDITMRSMREGYIL